MIGEGTVMRDDIIEIICEIQPLWDPDDEDMSIAEFLESKQLMELIVTLEDLSLIHI